LSPIAALETSHSSSAFLSTLSFMISWKVSAGAAGSSFFSDEHAATSASSGNIPT
jgi:hypothetical protein